MDLELLCPTVVKAPTDIFVGIATREWMCGSKSYSRVYHVDEPGGVGAPTIPASVGRPSFSLANHLDKS